MTTTPDLGIPEIAQSQSQPEVTHNEALWRFQMILNGVIQRGVNSPPGSPTEGDVYVVGTTPTGTWVGKNNCLAGFFGGAWIFVPGFNDLGSQIAIGVRNRGLTVYVRDENLLYIWDGADWASTGVGALISV
jgi:hypothetical protein